VAIMALGIGACTAMFSIIVAGGGRPQLQRRPPR
jgi:hypothetical protein